jgi:hypothetical protein
LTVGNNSFADGGDLGGSFAYAKDDFGETLTERPLVIDSGESQIFEGLLTKRVEQARVRGLEIDVAALHLREKLSQFRLGHDPLSAAVGVFDLSGSAV